MISKLFSHSFLYGIGPQVPYFVNLLVLPLISPHLTSLDYGIQGVLSSYTGLLGGLSELGLSVILVNTFYEFKTNNRWKFHWKRLFGFLSIWSVVYAAITASVVFLVMPSEASINKATIIVILFIQSALFSSTSLIAGRLYQLLEKPAYITFVTISTGLVVLLVNLVTIKYYHFGYMGWYYSGLAGALLSFSFYLFPLLRKYQLIPSFNISKKYVFGHLKVALPTLPHNYSSYLLNSSDRLVMDRLSVPISDLGTYNVGYSFGSYFNIIGIAVGMAVGPIMSKLWFEKTAESKKQIRLLVFALQALFLFSGFILALWSKEILPLLYRNKDFDGAYKYAGIIFMSYVFWPMYWGSINKLFFEKKTNQLWKISAIAGVLNVILNLIFIPIYGPLAAAISTFVCLLYLGFSGYFLSAYKKLDDVNYFPLLWLTLILILSVSVFFLLDSSVISKLVISGSCVFLLSFLFFIFKLRLQNIKI
jgi:O-antigen/teichoic acid export membrane protein